MVVFPGEAFVVAGAHMWILYLQIPRINLFIYKENLLCVEHKTTKKVPLILIIDFINHFGLSDIESLFYYKK